MFKRKNLKYPLYLFIFILFAKVGYIFVESFYNYHVLTITTAANLSQEAVEELNTNGHRISAIGITLLILPFLYILVKKLETRKMILSLFLLSIVTYFLTFEGLNIVVDKIVETNKEKRHDAYYVNIFKYGILNNIFSYDSFIDSKKITENNLNVNDKILLTNTFLLLNADKNLITKLKERGRDRVADLYIEKNLKNDYEKKFQAFKQVSTDVSNLWNEINKNRKILKEKLSQLDETGKKKAYNNLVTSLKLNYTKYKKGSQQFKSTLYKETSVEKIDSHYNSLKRYFRYQKYDRAKRQYRESMINNFGHYIEPNKWLDGNNQLTRANVKFVIESELLKQAQKKFGDLPIGLSVKEFMYHYETKLAVMKKLKKYDISIPYDFDYSFKQFSKYFDVMASAKTNEAYTAFYTKLKDKIGSNDIKLNMTWKEFIYSDFIQQKLQEKIKDGNLTTILEALYSKDLANFKNMIYLPPIKNKIDEMMYKKSQFHDGDIACHKGDEAIKLLYIPPFALSVSIIALLLNILTVFGMLLSLTNLNTKIVYSLKVGFIVLVIILPMLKNNGNFNNQLIQKVSTQKIQNYLNFLNWLSYYETINYNLHAR